MSNHLAIATVTTALKGVVERGMGWAGPGPLAHVRRPFAPTGDPTGQATIFLYAVSPNGAQRNGDLPFRSGDQTLVARPAAALDLDYLISFYGDEAKLEPQRLLAGAVAAIHAEAEIGRGQIRALALPATAANVLADTDLDGQPDLVRFTPLPMGLEDLSRLWTTFVGVPYVLSVAYRASAVLVEPPVAPRPSQPVRERNLTVLQVRRPEIDAIVAEAAPGAPPIPELPIPVRAVLVVRGRRLRGDATAVRIGEVQIPVRQEDMTDGEIRVPLDEPPFDAPEQELRAGVLGVQVVHLLPSGRPATASEIVPFALRPRVVSTVHAVVGGQGVLTVVTDPPVRLDQRARLSLNAPASGDASGFAFPASRRQDGTSALEVPIADVPAGTYVVRVEIDGAESPLDPTVTAVIA